MELNGTVEPRFAALRDTFAASLESGEDLGGAVAVVIDGETVADLSGGWQDRKKTVPWTAETIVTIYSSGKAVIALLVAREVAAGRLDYERPVADYWPEFAAAGKQDVTVGQILSHQAGLPGFPDPIDPAEWLDWDAICSRLAAMAPMWQPGTALGYHPQTFGYLAGELLRRVTGRSVGQILREDFTGPHGIQVFCGLTDEEIARASAMTKPTAPPDLGEINEYKKAAFLTKWASPAGVDRAAWAKAEIPASNCHADARSLARLMNAFACEGRFEGERLFPPDICEAATHERACGDDLVLPYNLCWAAGVMRNSQAVYGPGPHTIGHYGFGGSCLFADPGQGLSFAYVPNRMSPHLVADPRAMALIDAVYESL